MQLMLIHEDNNYWRNIWRWRRQKMMKTTQDIHFESWVLIKGGVWMNNPFLWYDEIIMNESRSILKVYIWSKMRRMQEVINGDRIDSIEIFIEMFMEILWRYLWRWLCQLAILEILLWTPQCYIARPHVLHWCKRVMYNYYTLIQCDH
jgi:hypothetical protein